LRRLHLAARDARLVRSGLDFLRDCFRHSLIEN
jgi:hypothetical protein